MPVMVRYRCQDCKAIRKGGPEHRWCDLCGGELRKAPYGQRKHRRGRT